MSERIISVTGEPPTPPSFDLVPWSCPATSGCVCWLIDWGLRFTWIWLAILDPIDFNWFTLYPCAMSFFQRLCSAPFPPVSCSFPEPHPDPQGCLYNLLERQPENSWPWEGNTLFNIQPPNPTQYWSHWRSWGCPNSSMGNPRRSSRLDLPRDWSSKGCHASTCSGIL